jgi:hypothetical protein
VEGATFAAEVACNACSQRAASRCIRIASALWQVPSYPVVTAINVAAVGVLFFIMFIVKTDFGEQANKWTGCDTRGSSACGSSPIPCASRLAFAAALTYVNTFFMRIG